MKWLPWIMAAMWLVARFSVRQFFDFSADNAKTFGVLSNLLLIVILVFVSIYYKYKAAKNDQETFFQDFTHCMRTAMKFVIGAAISIYLYYGILRKDDLEFIKKTQIEAFANGIASDESLAAFKTENPAFKDFSRDALVQKKTEEAASAISAKNETFGGLLTLTVVSLMYSLLATSIWRLYMKRI